MAYKNIILLGKITKVSGFDGAVAVKLEKVFTENIPEMESVFLEIDGRPVPFLISAMEYNSADTLKLTFDGFPSDSKVAEFTGSLVFLEEGKFNNDSSLDPLTLTGFKLIDRSGALIGSVTDMISNSSQWILEVKSISGKNILVPLHEDLIEGIDKKKKIISMDLPEGLLEIN